MRLSCTSIYEPGEFGTDSGTVVVPSGDEPFRIEITGSAVVYGGAWGYAVLPDDDDHYLLLF